METLRNRIAQRTVEPFKETKEQLGGVLILEAKDRHEATRLISNHPGIAAAGFEIHPTHLSG